MKRVGLCICSMLMLCACSNNDEKPEVVRYTNKLVEMYPNYRSNEISEAAMLDSIANHPRPIGQLASDLDGVDFRFARLIENPNDGSQSALFVSDGCMSDIENPNGKPKYLITDIHIRVLGKVESETAAKLDGHAQYRVSGILHAWDANDVFFVTNKVGASVDFGTYILDEMTVERVGK